MPTKSTDSVTNDMILSFLWLKNTSNIHTYAGNFFILLVIIGYLRCFQVLVIINNAAMNVWGEDIPLTYLVSSRYTLAP